MEDRLDELNSQIPAFSLRFTAENLPLAFPDVLIERMWDQREGEKEPLSVLERKVSGTRGSFGGTWRKVYTRVTDLSCRLTFLKYPPWSRMWPFSAGIFLNFLWQSVHSTGFGSALADPAVCPFCEEVDTFVLTPAKAGLWKKKRQKLYEKTFFCISSSSNSETICNSFWTVSLPVINYVSLRLVKPRHFRII